MGYSCTNLASIREAAISDRCFQQTGVSNNFKVNDDLYFYEVGRENSDGAITGSIYLQVLFGKAKKRGSFRINPNGTIARGPAFFKETKLFYLEIKGGGVNITTKWDGKEIPNKENVLKAIEDFRKVNSHINFGTLKGVLKTRPDGENVESVLAEAIDTPPMFVLV